MANYVKNEITVIGNEQVQNKMKEFMEIFQSSDKRMDTKFFAEVFYKNPQFGEESNGWYIDNLGTKWAYMEDINEDTEFTVTSAWSPVTEFIQHLYNILVELDPDVSVENRFEDEGFNPVGGMVVYNGMYSYGEEYDFEYPNEDEMDEDDDYDKLMDDFYENIDSTKSSLIHACRASIERGQGTPIEYREEEIETENN